MSTTSSEVTEYTFVNQQNSSLLLKVLEGHPNLSTADEVGAVMAKITNQNVDDFTVAIRSFPNAGELFRKIIAFATETDQNKGIKLLRRGSNAEATLSPREARFLMANAFLGNIKRLDKFGDLSFHRFLAQDVERTKCQLAYFGRAQEASDEQSIIFKRLQYQDNEKPDWRNSQVLVDVDKISVHTGRMEDVPADAFVDFANRKLHIHKLIASATQEEVLFSCCPECFPGILICETLLNDEVMIIKGARRFMDYTGYLYTFKFDHDFPPKPAQDIIVLDAVEFNHFSVESQLRDMNKAFFGFSMSKQPEKPLTISTGHWGCGIFGGDKSHKFLQQVCAASLAGVSLQYSTFKEENTKDAFDALLRLIRSKSCTIGTLFGIMCDFYGQRANFHSYAIGRLSAL